MVFPEKKRGNNSFSSKIESGQINSDIDWTLSYENTFSIYMN